MTSTTVPPTTRPEVQEAISYVRWALTMFIIAFFVMLLWGIVDLLGYFLRLWWWGDLIGGIVRLVFAFMAIFSYGYVRSKAYAPMVLSLIHI